MPQRTQALVSIGLPVYNGERYLQEALGCLLGQSWQNIELIISDNASIDATRDICEAVAAADGRVRYIRQSQNLGAMGNFQFVLEAAQGEYFMWAACDDRWDLEWISALMGRLQTRPDAIAAYGRLQHIDAAGNPMAHPANNAVFPYGGPALLRRLKYFLQFEGNGKANPIYAIFRRSALAGLHLPDYSYDYLLVFDLLRKGCFLSASEVVLYKRIHASSEGASVMAGSGFAAVLQELLCPVPRVLMSGYFFKASVVESLTMGLLSPVKLMVACAWRGARFLLARVVAGAGARV